MAKQLIRKAEFARRAGVTQGAITRAVAKSLAPAMDGDLIDFDHPAAQSYIARQTAEPEQGPLPGTDVLYAAAVMHCQTVGRWSISGIQRGCRIGFKRAEKIADSMKALGAWPANYTEPEPEPEPVRVPQPLPPMPAPKRPPPKEPPSPPPPPSEESQIPGVPEDIASYAHMSLLELIEKFGTDDRFTTWLNAIQKIEGIRTARLKNAKTEGTLVARTLVRAGVFDPIDGSWTKLLTDGRQTISARAHAAAAAGGTVKDVDAIVGDLLRSFISPVKDKMIRIVDNLGE